MSGEYVSCKLGADLDCSGLSQKKLKYAQNSLDYIQNFTNELCNGIVRLYNPVRMVCVWRDVFVCHKPFLLQDIYSFFKLLRWYLWYGHSVCSIISPIYVADNPLSLLLTYLIWSYICVFSWYCLRINCFFSGIGNATTLSTFKIWSNMLIHHKVNFVMVLVYWKHIPKFITFINSHTFNCLHIFLISYILFCSD